MPGKHSASHRAPGRARAEAEDRGGRRSVPPWAIALAVVVALVPAAWFTAHRAFGDDPGPATPSTTSTASDQPIPAVSPSSPAQTPTPSGTPTPTNPPAKPTANLPRVAEDVPRRLTSGSLLDTGFDASIEPVDGVFTARSSSEVSRWGSRGEPGSPGTDTVFVIGDVNADGSGAFADLPHLRAGAKVEIRTDSGTLTYTVRSVGSHPAAGISTDPAVVAKVPNTLVLLGIRYDAHGQRTGSYVVVKADLTAAR